MSDVDVRASDDERQATIDRLAAHYRAGRLNDEELEERTAAAHAARTRGDLAALEADLPVAPADQDAERVARRRRVRERAIGAAGTCALLWVIWLVTGADGFVWPAIPTAAMLIGVLTDAFGGTQHAQDAPRAAGLPGVPPLPPPPQRRHDRD